MPLGRRWYSPGRMLAWGAVLVAGVVFSVFISALSYPFVALDDYAYVVNNHHIATLDWGTVGWAFTSFHEGNWHPLTMLSLALDRRLWGLDPSGFRLVNIVLHSLTVVTVCHLFYRLLSTAYSDSPEAGPGMGGLVAGSLGGALGWGLHPLRVESVVWVSERKDALCLFLLTAALYCYLSYARQAKGREAAPFWRFPSYWATLVFTVLALMSKAVAVSIPLILWIIDWYSLDRRDGRRATIEKIPFVALAAATALLAMLSQQGAARDFVELGLAARLLVASKALFFYLAKTLWPSGLGPFYLHPGNVLALAPGEYLGYALLGAVFLIMALRTRRRWAAALCGYYVVTLMPMLGLVQVGGQWVADRYSYLPGLALALGWGGLATWLAGRLGSPRTARWAALGLVLLCCQVAAYGVLTAQQILVWQSTETLTTRIIDLQPHRTGEVYYVRAVHRDRAGRHELALQDIGEAMRCALRENRRGVLARIAFAEASILKNLGRIPEALAMAEWGGQVLLGPPAEADVGLRDELRRLMAEKQQAARGGGDAMSRPALR